MRLLIFVVLISSIIPLAIYSHAVKTPPNDRYFFIRYSGTTKEGYAYAGGIDYITPNMVNLEEARLFIKRQQGLKKVFITSIL